MPKITTRRGVWAAVVVLTLVVLSGSAYLLTRSHPEFPSPVPPPDRHGLFGEAQRAKKLPEYAELKAMNAKENRPLTPKAVARVGELAGHPNFWIRLTAVGILENTPDPLRAAAAPLVAPRLKDDNLFVRLTAMDVLAGFGAKEYAPDILRLTNSDDEDERKAARLALKRLGQPIG